MGHIVEASTGHSIERHEILKVGDLSFPPELRESRLSEHHPRVQRLGRPEHRNLKRTGESIRVRACRA